jgi:hypothetical protein
LEGTQQQLDNSSISADNQEEDQNPQQSVSSHYDLRFYKTVTI